MQGQSRRLRRRRRAVQGRNLPVRDAGGRRGEAALEGHAGARGPDGRHQRVRQEGAREPVEVPPRRVPVREGRADRTGVPVTISSRSPSSPSSRSSGFTSRVRKLALGLATATLLTGTLASPVAFARRQPPPAVIPTEETKQAEQLYRAA